MMTNHTPGPWKTAHHGEWIVGRDDVFGEMVVCKATALNWAADARLIAAAPDLLAALEELIAEWDATHADEDHRTGYTLDTNGIRMARDAIARATGADQ